MRRHLLPLFALAAFCCTTAYAQEASSNEHNLDEVVVTATLTEVNLKNVPMTVSVVSPIMLEDSKENALLPTVSKHTPGLFLTQRGIVGFGISGGGSGGMTMRGVGGSPTTGMLVLIDGNPQYMGLMGHHLPDAYESSSTERVEVVRGPASILYGSNAMGGVMNIITKKQKEDGSKTHARTAYGSYNTFQSQFSNGYKKEKFNSFVSFSSDQTEGHRENSEFKQYSGYARLGYDISQNWKVSGESNVLGFWSSNPGTIAVPMIDNDAQAIRGVASIALANTYERTSGSIKGFYNFGEHKINDGYNANSAPRDYLFHSNDYMAGFSIDQSVKLFTGNTTTWGVDYKKYGGKAVQEFFDGREDGNQIAGKPDGKAAVNEIAGFMNIQQRIANIITLNAGLRYDYNDVIGKDEMGKDELGNDVVVKEVTGKGVLVPQGGISIAASQTTTIKAVVGKGFRNPTIREMYMFPPRNPNLDPESMVNYEVSLLQNFLNNRLTFEVNGYFIDGKNMIQTLYNPSLNRGENINTGKFKNAGVEFASNYKVNRYLSLMLNYSYLHFLKIEKEVNGVKEKVENPLLAAPQHNMVASGRYSRAGWTAYTSIQYIGNLYTVLPTQAAPEGTTESYVMWDVMAAYRFNKYLEGFVKGENLLNKTYEINAGFPMPGATVMAGVSIKI